MTDIIDRILRFTELTPECDEYESYIKTIYTIHEYKDLTDSDIFNKMAEIVSRIKREHLSIEFVEQYDKCLSMLSEVC